MNGQSAVGPLVPRAFPILGRRERAVASARGTPLSPVGHDDGSGVRSTASGDTRGALSDCLPIAGLLPDAMFQVGSGRDPRISPRFSGRLARAPVARFGGGVHFPVCLGGGDLARCPDGYPPHPTSNSKLSSVGATLRCLAFPQRPRAAVTRTVAWAAISAKRVALTKRNQLVHGKRRAPVTEAEARSAVDTAGYLVARVRTRQVLHS